MNTKNYSLFALASMLILSACSTPSYDRPISSAETAAAARSVEALNRNGGVTPQYGNYTQAAGAPVATRTAYQANPVSTLISVQDKLNINVFKVPDLSASALIVESNGTISMPLIGSVKVTGMTIAQAEQSITQKLKQYMQDPKVSIVRTDKAISNRVTVEGEVKSPGVFPIKGNLSFLQAIAMAQGLSEIANSRNVMFYRDGGQHLVNLDLVRTGQIADPVLRGDDRIVVLKDRAKVREKKTLEYIPAVLAPISVLGGFL